MFASRTITEARDWQAATKDLPPEVVERARELSRTTRLDWRTALHRAIHEHAQQPPLR